MDQRPPSPDDGRAIAEQRGRAVDATRATGDRRHRPPAARDRPRARRSRASPTSAAVDAIERFVPGESAEGDDGCAAPGVVRLSPAH